MATISREDYDTRYNELRSQGLTSSQANAQVNKEAKQASDSGTSSTSSSSSSSTTFKPDFTKSNPYEDAPASYIEKIKGTEAYNSAVKEGWIEDTTWKPDFTSETPYADMPEEYAEKVEESYVPTVEQPLSPVERAAEAGQVSSAYKPELITLPDQTQVQKPYLQLIQQESPELYRVLTEQGYNAYQQALIQQQKASARELELNYTKLPDGNYISNEDVMKLRDVAISLGLPEKKYEELALKEGYDEMQKVLDEDIIADFESSHVPLTDKDGNVTYITVDDFNNLYKYDQEHGTEYQAIAIKEGYDEMMKVIDEDTAKISQISQGVDNSLSKYKTKEDSYDIVSYLRDGGNEQVLQQSGFNQSDIDNAIELSKIPESYESFREKYAQENFGTSFSDILSRKQKNNESNDEYYQRLQDQDLQLKQISNAYNEKYGSTATVLSNIGTTGEYVFAPARALKPEVTIKDISGMEWALGAAQVALLALPGVGGIAGKVGGTIAKKAVSGLIRGSSGIIFSKSIYDNWDNMSTPEKAISIGLTGLLFTGELATIGKRTVMGGKNAVKINESIGAGSSKTSEILAKANPELVNPYNNIVNSQKSYAQSLYKYKQTKDYIQGKNTELYGKANTQYEINVASERLKQLEKEIITKGKKLEIATNEYTGKSNIFVDSPEIKTELNNLYKSLINSTDKLIDNIVSPRSSSIIKAELKQAYNDLVSNRTSTNARNVMELQRELLISKAGSVEKLATQNVEMLNRLDKLVGKYLHEVMTGGKNVTVDTYQKTLGTYADIIEEYITRIRANTKAINNEIYNMELLAGEDSSIIKNMGANAEDVAKEIDKLLKSKNMSKFKSAKFKDYPIAKDIKLIELTSKQLKSIKAGETPKQIKGQKGLKNGLTIDDIIYSDAGDLETRIKLNQKDIELVDDFIKGKKITSKELLNKLKERKQLTEKRIQEDKKKLLELAEKQKTERPLEKTTTIKEMDKYLPDRLKESKIARYSKSAEREIPIKEVKPDTSSKIYVQEVKKGKEKLSASPSTSPKVDNITVPSEKTKEYIKLSSETSNKPSVVPSEKTDTSTSTGTSTSTETDTQIKPEPEPAPKPIPEPVPAPTPIKVPVKYTPFTEAGTGIPIVGLTRLQTNSPQSQPIPEGSIAWVQGTRKGIRGVLVQQWYYIPPPYNQSKPIAMTSPPTGAKLTGSNKPKETIQIIGRSRTAVPKEINIDLGWSDIKIVNGNRIEFQSGGEKTNVGTGEESNTKGMSRVEGESIIDDYPDMLESKGINRPSMSKKAPIRKVKKDKEAWLDRLTSVKGIKY